MGGRDKSGLRGQFGGGKQTHRDIPVSVGAIYLVCRAIEAVRLHFNSLDMGLDLSFFLREEEGDKKECDFDDLDAKYICEHLSASGECVWMLKRQVKTHEAIESHPILDIYLFLGGDDQENMVSLGLVFPEDTSRSNIKDIKCSTKNGAISYKALAKAIEEGICTAITGAGVTSLTAMLRQSLVDEFCRVYTGELGLKQTHALSGDDHDKGWFPSL